MPANLFKIKIKNGATELEAEGTQQFVEKQLQSFSNILQMPSAEDKPIVKSLKRAKRRTSMKQRIFKQEKQTPLSQETPRGLKQFLKQDRPKNQPQLAMALAKFHTLQLKKDHFTSKEISQAARTTGKKFTNLPQIFQKFAKQGKVKKISKGTWSLTEASQQTAPASKKAVTRTRPRRKRAKK